jgi:hypothetical protein
MVLGTAYYNAARSAVGNRPGPLLAFCNACLALLALVVAVVAGDTGSLPAENASPMMDRAAPERLPSPELLETPTTPAAEKERKSAAPRAAAKERTSVLLPPIQSLPAAAIVSSAPSPSSRPSSNRPLPPSLLEPPPSIKRTKPQAAKPPPEPAQVPKPRSEPSAQAPIYQTLEQEINKTFAGSTVHLQQVGDKLVVSGTARNLFEALRILNLAREHAPGGKAGEAGQAPSASPSLQAILDNYAHAGGPHVINLLRIPGEQQIMLRVLVAEVNRPAARSLGLDFGIADKKATVLPSRPAAADGSSTVADNGWIGQLVRILQDLHYAKILAEPTLTTLNGQAARFKAGGELPIPVISVASRGAVQGVVFRSYGVQLSIQPILADVDRICLAVDAEVSGTDAQAAIQVGGTAVPGLKVRNFQSTVELREGETLAVAGLVRGGPGNTLPQNVGTGVANPASADQDLVVLISPLLLRRPPHKGGGDAKRGNPQDLELYLRSRNTMVPRGDALYLIGPQGYAGKQNR